MGPQITSRVLIRRRWDSRSRDESDVGPGAKLCRQPLAAGQGKETNSSPELAEGAQSCRHLDFSPVMPLTSRIVRE